MAVPTYVTIEFTRSISERKQIMLNVQSKRACERIVIAGGGVPALDLFGEIWYNS